MSVAVGGRGGAVADTAVPEETKSSNSSVPIVALSIPLDGPKRTSSIRSVSLSMPARVCLKVESIHKDKKPPLAPALLAACQSSSMRWAASEMVCQDVLV